MGVRPDELDGIACEADGGEFAVVYEEGLRVMGLDGRVEELAEAGGGICGHSTGVCCTGGASASIAGAYVRTEVCTAAKDESVAQKGENGDEEEPESMGSDRGAVDSGGAPARGGRGRG